MTAIDERRDAPALPRWDVTDIYPSLTSREYAAAREAVGADLARLRGLYDEHDVREGDDKTADAATVAAFESVLAATNDLLERVRTVGGYISSYVSSDARDDLAQGELSAMQAELAELSRLRGRFDAWIASIGVEGLVGASLAAADHAYPLQRAAFRATYQMSEAEESLLADLQLTGSSAWSRLYRDVSARLTATLHHADGRTETLPMSKVRGLAYDPDAAVRRAAYDAELEAWEGASVPIAAALNSVKGEAATVNRRRGWPDDLEPALVANNVDRHTLDAMQSAVVASFPDFRRYLRAKARLLGSGEQLPFYDLFAPLEQPGGGGQWEWEQATSAVTDYFGSYSPRLRSLATRAMDEAWIDAEPRDGKGSGAFCMSLVGDRSLVSLNFDGSFRSVQTLAHELGHAYHNVNLAERTPYQRATPMALAETASIFCETLMVERGLAAAAPEERLPLLEGDLQSTCQIVVDIHSRFLFEKAVCEQRAKRALSVAELNEIMLDAQEQTYGDGMDPALRHQYMWAAKPHYYGSAFYNWPYTFGLLFGIGLYAEYVADPEKFEAGYDDLLSSTGLGDAATLAGRFGIDVTDEAFWTASLDVLRARIDEFCSLAKG